jgi:hypothetical protein
MVFQLAAHVFITVCWAVSAAWAGRMARTAAHAAAQSSSIRIRSLPVFQRVSAVAIFCAWPSSGKQELLLS